MDGSRETPGSAPSPGRALPENLPVDLALVGGLALLVRLVDLGHPPFVDELYHVLASQALLEEGSPVILEGEPYTRALLFTYLVTGFMAVLGESLEAARLPAVLAGTALVCLVFAWLRLEANRVAAWTGGLLLGFAPISIYLSQWVRFYTLHALFIWLGIIGLYWLLTREGIQGRRAALLGGGSLLFLAGAFHLQLTAAVAAGGLALFACILLAPRVWRAAIPRVGGWGLLVGGAALLAGASAVGLWTGVHAWVADHLRLVDFWAREHADNPFFYHRLLRGEYGFLWTLLPVAALAGFTYRWRPTLLLAAVLGVALILHSAAAWKAERYIFYALPALFGLWGLAAGLLLPWLWRGLRRSLRLLLPERGPGWIPGALATTAIGVALLLATTGVTAFTHTRQIYLEGRMDWEPPEEHLGERYRGHPDWGAVEDRLQRLKEESDILVSQSDLKAVHYLGDVDFLLHAGFLSGPRGGDEEFSPWPQVGRPVVSTPESVERLVRCYSTGVMVVEEHVWGWSEGVPESTAEWIEERASPVELPEEAGILAYTWGPGASGEGEDGVQEPWVAPGSWDRPLQALDCVPLEEIRARAPVRESP